MHGEREFFGGESLDEHGKKLASETERKQKEEAEAQRLMELGRKEYKAGDKETELVPWGELMTNVGEQMNKVVASLETERKMAAEIRGMGGMVTRETAEKMMDLERRKNELLKVYEDTLEPMSKESFLALLDGQELHVPKPEKLEEMMTDPDEMEITDDMIIEAQTSEALMSKENALREEADKANEEMVGIIERMHEAKNIVPKSLEDALRVPDPVLHESYIGVLETQFNDLYNYVRMINEKLRDVREQLQFVKKLEDKEGRKAA